MAMSNGYVWYRTDDIHTYVRVVVKIIQNLVCLWDTPQNHYGVKKGPRDTRAGIGARGDEPATPRVRERTRQGIIWQRVIKINIVQVLHIRRMCV